jgi:hypothetical protein
MKGMHIFLRASFESWLSFVIHQRKEWVSHKMFILRMIPGYGQVKVQIPGYR